MRFVEKLDRNALSTRRNLKGTEIIKSHIVRILNASEGREAVAAGCLVRGSPKWQRGRE